MIVTAKTGLWWAVALAAGAAGGALWDAFMAVAQ